MALERVKTFSKGKASVGRTPFLSDFVEENPNVWGFNFEITRIKETNSRNGFLIETKDFMVCIFKSSDLASVLMEWVEDLYSTHHCAGYIVLDQEEPEGFYLAYDTETKRTWLRKKKFPSGFVYSHDASGGRKAKPPKNLSSAT